MNRYFFEIAYDGTRYSGWQRQKNAITVQQTIEENIEKVLRIPIRIHGCGRTDAGVSAEQYFFHLDLENIAVDLAAELNASLPKDIAIIDILQVSTTHHAQLSASARKYEYCFTNRKSPFRPRTWQIIEPLDLSNMQSACEKIRGKHDFKNFCKRPDFMPNTVCMISEANLEWHDESAVYKFTISGNRFLHHMVRLLVGNIVKVGKGDLSENDFVSFLEGEQKPKYFELAPAEGLTLTEVKYEFNN